jgi:DNA-directed RNA polymerase specialized sigma24 family protein
LDEALAGLTEDQRRVVALRFLEGLTTAETARIVGKSEDAVKKLQARGLVRMRKSIETARRRGGETLDARAAPSRGAKLPMLGAA